MVLYKEAESDIELCTLGGHIIKKATLIQSNAEEYNIPAIIPNKAQHVEHFQKCLNYFLRLSLLLRLILLTIDAIEVQTPDN